MSATETEALRAVLELCRRHPQNPLIVGCAIAEAVDEATGATADRLDVERFTAHLWMLIRRTAATSFNAENRS